MRNGSVVVAVVMLLAGACSNDSVVETTTTTMPPTSSTSTGPTHTTSSTVAEIEPSGPEPGGEVVVAMDRPPVTLNPWAEGGDGYSTILIAQAWMTGVWDVDATTLELIPDVVTELPTVDNGGLVVNDDGTMTVTYTIVPGARWEDGTPITGYDFEYTVAASLRSEAPLEFDTPYTNAGIQATEAHDTTFAMTLETPTLGYESLFQWILPSHALDETTFPEDWDGTLWPAGGPFHVVESDPGQPIVLERNENYWKTDAETNQQLPYLDRVEFVVTGDTDQTMTAFRNHEVDVINPNPDIATVVDPLVAMEPRGVSVQIRPGSEWEQIGFQFSPARLKGSENSCNENLNMRRAVIAALDREKVVDEVFGGYAQPMSSYVDAFTPSLSTHDWDQYVYDPDRAQALYRQAVSETGVECAVVFTTTSNGEVRPMLADMYADMFAAAGIPYRNDLVDSQMFFGELFDEGTWDLGQWPWVGASGLAALVAIHDVFDPANPPPDGDNVYNWGTRGSSVIDESTERFTAIVSLMHNTVDADEIADLVAEAQSILANQLVTIPLYSRITVGAVWADEIVGYEHNPRSTDTWNIEYWYRVD